MTENKKFCPKCGTAHTPSAKFCRKCGETFSVQNGFPETDMLRKAANTLDKAESTLSKVTSTVTSAESLAERSQTLSTLIIQPPVEWSVFVGDIDSEAGKKAIERMFSETEGKIEGRIQQEVSTRIEDVIEKTREPQPLKSVSSPPSTQPMESSGSICPSCGTTIQPNKKFCGTCGAKVTVPIPEPAPTTIKPPSTSRMICPKCEILVAPGKKFCGRCGTPVVPRAKVDVSVPKVPTCPKCGSPITPGKKFCGSCGGKLDV